MLTQICLETCRINAYFISGRCIALSQFQLLQISLCVCFAIFLNHTQNSLCVVCVPSATQKHLFVQALRLPFFCLPEQSFPMSLHLCISHVPPAVNLTKVSLCPIVSKMEISVTLDELSSNRCC